MRSAVHWEGNDPGAQTGRPDDVRPVRGLLGGAPLPAALFIRHLLALGVSLPARLRWVGLGRGAGGARAVQGATRTIAIIPSPRPTIRWRPSGLKATQKAS